MVEYNLAAPCGLFCGACRQYLVRKKNLLESKGFKRGCEGCRIRNKKCAFIRRDCPQLRTNEITFCYECDDFPCANLKKLDKSYQKNYSLSIIKNLERIKEIGPNDWLKEQKKLYVCPECEGEFCMHDAECYDCGFHYNPNK